ncbi:hypothetical protein MPER_04032, partial [Moniliophthora perniciosa FA553]
MASRHTTAQPQKDRIAEVLHQYTTTPELELQQRAVEFASLFNLGELRAGVLERMPPPELKATVMGVVSENKPVGSSSGGDLIGLDDSISTSSANGLAAQGSQDLLNEIFSTTTPSTSSGGGGTTPAPKSQQSTIDDILGLFGTPSNTAPVSAPPPGFNPASSPPPTNPTSAFSLPQSQSPASTPVPVPQAPTAPKLTPYTAYERNNLKITLTPPTSAAKPGIVMILARFQVTGSSAATGLQFQAAVPKSQQLQMLPMSNPNI